MNYIKGLCLLLCSFLSVCLSGQLQAQSFIHPGLLQNAQDIARMKAAILAKQEPVYSGFLVFQAHSQSQNTYHMQGPMEMVGRNPTVGQGIYDADANAAYQNALIWALTGTQLYADKAIEIVNAWSSTLKSITGRDAVLMAGLGPFKMVNAAEILRYTHSGWSAADIERTESHFREVIYPVIKDFAPFANGNWDSAAMKTMMAIGVFCNDRPIFERALHYYINGAGDGSLLNYIINETGQCQESGRDQSHTQLGIAHLGDCAEMGWHQGLNLYAYADNRLLKGFEYTAKFNLGQDVPYVPAMDMTGKYWHQRISVEGRGRLRAVYEQIYNHYVNRMGLAAPYTQAAAEKIRPEQQGLPGADHVGFGTLLYSRTAGSDDINTIPAAPAGLLAQTTSTNGNTISWVACRGANYYTLKRSEQKNGPYTVLAGNITGLLYRDTKALQGRTYYYTVSASDKSGGSANAYPVSITTGFPIKWKAADIGSNGEPKGSAVFDGRQFTITSGGMGIDSVQNQFKFIYTTLKPNGTITARYVPQVSSQFSGFGLAIREGLEDSDIQAALIVKPELNGQPESPGWHTKLFFRNVKDGIIKDIASGPVLSEPVVIFSRLTGYYWLRLQRKGAIISAYSSVDGKNWAKIGSINRQVKKNALVGLVVSSGLASVPTVVKFDQVTVY
ncbi:alginate lyase family protein [Mucilaginibacter sp. AW1-7]|uniref:alginate lyase family protein n=1 Tax=Mucilaginibacter sp. AW1-7 TaxID=3349874 RepID=UPI003F73BAB1